MTSIGHPSPLTPDERRHRIILRATSTTQDQAGATSVLVYWQPVPDVVGYTLYRRAGGHPVRLNGGAAIRRVRTCAELEAVIPRGSPEWDILSRAFAAVAARESHAIESVHGIGRLREGSVLTGQPGDPVEPVGALAPGVVLRRSSPCTAFERGLTAEEERLLEVAANVNLAIRFAAGLAFTDPDVTTGTAYTYELRGVREDGTEITWGAEVAIVAGTHALPAAPSGLAAQPGDRKVLCTWDRSDDAFGWFVDRAPAPAGPYQRVTAEPALYDVEQDVHGADLAPPRPGHLDWQRFDDDGLPTTHTVDGIAVGGPENDVTHHYRVASLDILGRLGPWSAPVAARPVRSTPPAAPTDLSVAASTDPLGIALEWRTVTADIAGHRLLDATATYRIHRAETMAELDDVAALPGHVVATLATSLVANPTDPATPTLGWTDTDPVLRVPYGEKDFWYRITCVDAQGLVSAPSAVLAGRMPDVTPPGPTLAAGIDSGARSITIYWEENTEPDLAGYQVYRSVCDRGRPFRPLEKGELLLPCDFVLVGSVTRAEAEKMLAESGGISFEDTSVPEGSPVCYAYWVRAYDHAQNLYSGDHGCPASPAEYLCERLQEETPPPVPVLTGLRARDGAVLVEWMSSPVQDLRAFHVYRSREEFGPLEFAGGVLTDGTLLVVPYEGVRPECTDLPAEPSPDLARGSFLDRVPEPNEVYWYRVSALDWLGNESEGADLTRIPAVSTFAYTTDLPPVPVLAPAVGSAGGSAGTPAGTQAGSGCGLVVRWAPAFDAATLRGFLVFRSTSGGPFQQVSGLVEDATFTDTTAIRGLEHAYRVQAVDAAGRLSAPSAPVIHPFA